MTWTEYNIQEGQQNFTPADAMGLTWRGEFRFRVVFHHSCYYSLEQWQGDGDWYDVNKLVGHTLAYTPNNHLAFMAGWNPGHEPGRILVSPYTNYPGSQFQYHRSDSLAVQTVSGPEQAEATGHVIDGLVTRNSRRVHYRFQRGGDVLETAHSFRLRWYMPALFRRVGTWFGGADNSPGEYGGRAPWDMKLWLQFEKI